jgi:hypothetical protein
MQKCVWLVVCLMTLAVPAAFAGVSVNAPSTGSTVQSPVHYVASATTTTCSKGVASMGIYTADAQLAYITQGSTLNTNLNLSPGTYHTVVEEWDYCGGATTTPITVTVSNESGVEVASPANDSTVSDPVRFTATASSSCAQGVASVGIYTAPGQLAYVANGSTLNTALSLNPGTYNTVVQEWDRCGGASKTPITINVTSSATDPSQVSVSSPTNNSTDSSPVLFTATSTSSCAKGVASMGIYTAPGQLAYVSQGSTLKTDLPLAAGNHTVVVQEWDRCGGAAKTPVTFTAKASSGVSVSEPTNNTTVTSPVKFDATASSSSCAAGVSSMGIYTAPGQLAYVSQGTSLNTNLSLNPGTYQTVVEEWDKCGGAATTPITITVSAGTSLDSSFSNLQRNSAWGKYGQRSPTFVDCSPSPCDDITFSMNQGVNSPSMSGDSSEFDLGQGAPYGDALFNNHLIGDQSSQGLPDKDKTLVPSLHNFVYDVYFYGANVNASQALEFDINQFTNGLSFIWGHECRVAGGNEWDIWDNQSGHWVATGVPCHPKSDDWNHLVIQVERTSDNQLLYQSITLNGQQYNVNTTYAPTSTSWYGVTINYQMDGNSSQTPYNVYLDKLTFRYW